MSFTKQLARTWVVLNRHLLNKKLGKKIDECAEIFFFIKNEQIVKHQAKRFTLGQS